MATPIPLNRAPLDARSVAEVTGGRVVAADPSGTLQEARGVTTDSRAVARGGAFVAIRGPRLDGHAFVPAAVDAGAVLLVVERGRVAPPTARSGSALVDVVEVDDTLAAWGAVAAAHLRRWRSEDRQARIVGITGSAGKTTTKEMCAALLGTVAPCLATTGNLNNRIGLPAVALRAEAGHRFVVLEMGMSEPGEIAVLAAVARPDVAIITNIGLAHAGGVGGTIAAVAREKGAIFAGLAPGGVAVANADDAAVLAELARAPAARVVTFGLAHGADYRLVSREPLGPDGSRVTLERAGAGRAVFRVPIPGAAAAIDFAAALAASDAAAGVPLDEARVSAALSGLSPIAGRMNALRLPGGVLVLDDAYNASPATVRGALLTLAEVAPGRRVAVLGEMKELGASALAEHEALAEAVASAGVALLVTCGGMADAITAGAERLGVAVVTARDAVEAARAAVERVRPGDTVLVKASRSVGAERVVEALVEAGGEGRGRGAA